MPRIKADYVVSFSSEDSDHPANNLLGWEVSKKGWLCKKGEPSCSVVLQLARAVKINSVCIGAHNAALVEVLVGRSEAPHEPFQVLVPRCVVASAAESRRDEPLERVRSFSADQLCADASTQRWDRVRVVCSQPYNSHCKYGLKFVHVFSPDAPDTEPAAAAVTAAPPAVPRRLPPDAAADAASSDDEFTPGELFAKHRAADTGAQIRQATSQALKNISDASCKLVKSPITQNIARRHDQTATEDRARDKTHRNKDEKTTDDKPRISQKHEKQDSRKDTPYKDDRKGSQKDSSSNKQSRGDRTPRDERKNRQSSAKESRDRASTSHQSRDDNVRKRERSPLKQGPDKACVDLKSVLSGVVLTLSGYENPRRRDVRDLALRLGARVEREWTPRCNHLICAFPNTPKLKQVRAGGGGATPVTTAEWLEACRDSRRRVPWQWFATEPARRRPRPHTDTDDTPRRSADETPRGDTPPRGADALCRHADSECDTDDEIEKALRKQKKRRTERSPARDTRDTRHDDDQLTDDDTDGFPTTSESISGSATLPELFGGATFVISPSATRACGPRLLERYVRAYGGLLVPEEELEEDGSSVDYVLSASPRRARAPALSPRWLWRCHETRTLVPYEDFLIT